jgi:O-antigen/teichoic acid export membrane protein
MSLIPAFIRTRIAHRPNLSNIVDNVSWLFFDKLLRMGVGLFIGVWIARYLGPEQFGLLSFATAFVGMFGAIAALGLQGIVVRDLVRNPEGARETLGTAAILQLIGGLVAYLLMLVVIVSLRPDDTVARTIVAILGSMTLLEASKVAVFWFESQVQSKYTVWVQDGVFLVFAALKVVLILQQASLVDFVWATLVEALIAAIILLCVMSLRGPSFATLRVSAKRGMSLLCDSWPLILSSIAITIYMKIDQIMLGQMISDEAAGFYAVATRISEVWYFIPMAIVASVFPDILEAKKKRSKEQYYARLQKLYDLMVAIGVAVALPMTFLSTTIITLLFGEAYLGAGAVLAIHIWASVFVFLGVASGKWILAENRQLLSFQRAALGAIVNIGLNLWLIPINGVIGAALATVVSQAIAYWLYDGIQESTQKMFWMKLVAMNPLRWSALISR